MVILILTLLFTFGGKLYFIEGSIAGGGGGGKVSSARVISFFAESEVAFLDLHPVVPTKEISPKQPSNMNKSLFIG